MKKYDFDKKYFQIAMLALLVIVISITYNKTVDNFTNLTNAFVNSINFISAVLTPFLIGFCIAYLINSGVKFFEKNSWLKNQKFLQKNKRLRLASMLCTYTLAFAFITAVISVVVPSVLGSINSLILSLPEQLESIQVWWVAYLNENKSFIQELTNTYNKFTSNNLTTNDFITFISKPIIDFAVKIPDMLGALIIGLFGFIGMFLNIILGIVISAYMIYDKEYFSNLATKVVKALFVKRTEDSIFKVSNLANVTFEKFIIGKAIDSFIIGCLFFILAVIFNVPYASLFALIIGITNMIPYFGPFIGAVPVILITAIYDFNSVLTVGIIILALQQFDGIVLGPKILGDSIGLKPVYIMFSIIVGGALFGFVGMFLGAPIFAVLAVICSEFIDRLYLKKNE